MIDANSLSVNLEYIESCSCTYYMCTQHYQSQTAYSLKTYLVQFLSLLMNVKPKVIETERTSRGFLCQTVGGLVRSQNNLKLKYISNVLQNNQMN